MKHLSIKGTGKKIGVIICLFLSALLLTNCINGKNTIIIGSKNFTEQLIIGEMMAQLIEKNTNIKVSRKLNLGGTMVCFNALKAGEIDMYPEYTGTGLVAILKKNSITDKDKAYNIVKDDYLKEYNLEWLEPLGFNNTYTITMRSDQAIKLKIKTISDLKSHQNIIKTGFTSEFIERSDGLKGLVSKYNLKLKIKPKDLDPGLMYKAIKEKEVDVICGFATDGRIPAYNLLMIKDDKNFFPPYYAAPVARKETLDKYPELKNLLNKLGGKISDADMSKMNYAVDEGKPEKEVAKEFLKEAGLI